MTNKIDVERVADLGCTVGESPLWCAEQSAWYWVDIPARTIWRLDSASCSLRHWKTEEMVACVALKESGGMIAGMESGIFSLELGDDQTVNATKLAAPPGLGAGMRFNDGRCDRQGRFWSGTMYRYTASRGISASIVSGLLVQNGLAWSPDGRTMYLSDSHPSRQLIWAFDYDADDGVPVNQRVFVDMNSYPGRPDGAAVDSDGCYWICGNDGACVLRFTPSGKLARRIDLPMAKPSMCAFGGPNLDTLLVTSIGAGKAEGDTWAGAVLLLRPGVSGIAETYFPG